MTLLPKIILATGLTLLASTAQADLRICNETQQVQGVSIGYKGDVDWTSEGWWLLEPNKCATPVTGDLSHRYYYLRAEVDGGPFKGADYQFCTTPQEYTIVGDADCEARGYDREAFIEIDTGETAKSFTYALTQAVMDAEQGRESKPKQEALGLQFCNQTAETHSVSVGYKDGEDIVSEGWWVLKPGTCATPLPGALKTRFYYYRTEVNGGPFNGGTVAFCTDTKAYTIVGNDNCSARGYALEDFAEIDSGETSQAFTFTIR